MDPFQNKFLESKKYSSEVEAICFYESRKIDLL